MDAMNTSMKSDSQGFLVGERVATRTQPEPVSGLSVMRGMQTDVGVIRRLLEAGAGQRMRTAKAQAVTARGRGAAVPVGAVAATVADRRSAGLRTAGAGVATVQGAARGASNMPARDARGRFISTRSEPVVVALQRGAVVPKAGAAATGGQDGPGERDAKGRFAGGGQQSSDYAGGDGLLGKISQTLEGIGDVVGNTDQIDPTLAALKEVRDVVSPVGRGVMSLGQRLAERRKERWYDRILKAIKGDKGEGGGTAGNGSDVRKGSFFGTMLGELAGKLLENMHLGTLFKRIFAPVAAAWASWEVGQWLGKKIYDWLTESGLMGKFFDAIDSIKGFFKDKAEAVVGGAKKAVAAGAKIASDSKLGSDEARYRPLTPEDRREARLDRRGSTPDSAAYRAGAVAGTVMRGADVSVGAIRRLLGVDGTKRFYEKTDGSTEMRTGGTVSWRNNNPGNLKFEYAGSADKTVRSKRTKAQALESAQKRYEGVVDLDQFGNAIFATEAHGRAAKSGLLRGAHGARTVEEMLPKYAVNDYSGTANHAAYAAGIHKTADAKGINLRGKKIADLSPAEMGALLDGMKKVEGFKTGAVSVTGGPYRMPVAASTVAETSLLPVQVAAVPMSTPKHMPAAQAANIPERLNSSKQPPISVSVRGEVGQDVGDRTIAHVVTGGMGGKH